MGYPTYSSYHENQPDESIDKYEEKYMSQYSPQEMPEDKYPQEPQAATPDNTYSLFVDSLFKTGQQILESWGIPKEHITQEAAEKMSCIHAVLGIVGEAGELADAIKKPSMYQKLLDQENVQEELGDMKFYTQALVNTLNEAKCETDFGDYALELANRKKLDKRYKNGYSDKAAQERADKQELETPEVEVKIPEKYVESQGQIPIMTPRNWGDLLNWSRNKVIGVRPDWLLGMGMMESDIPSGFHHFVWETTGEVFFCQDQDKIDALARRLNFGDTNESE